MSDSRDVIEAVLRVHEATAAVRDMVERQLQALDALPGRYVAGSTAAFVDVLLVLYLDLGTVAAVAEFCNARGWKTQGRHGPRPFKPRDIGEVLRWPATPEDTPLRAMAQALRAKGPGRPERAAAPQ